MWASTVSWISPPRSGYTVLLKQPDIMGAVGIADIRLYNRSVFPDLARMWGVPYADYWQDANGGWHFGPNLSPNREEALRRADEYIELHRENCLSLEE